MPVLRQNNPVLYIFVDMPDDHAIRRIKAVHESRVDARGIGYMTINEGCKKEQISGDLQAATTQFLTKKYITSGEIKVVYVVNADARFAKTIHSLKQYVEYYLHFLYPGGVVSDIFLILDDTINLARNLNNYRGEVIQILSQMRSDNCMVYILSNVNNHRLFKDENDDNVYTSIALLCLLKDFVSEQPDKQFSEDQVYKWYNERFFKDDSYKNGGDFMTVGHQIIKKPIQMIKKLLLVELLIFKQFSMTRDCDFEWKVKKLPETNWNNLKDNIFGLAMDTAFDESLLPNFTNKQALERIFGKRLEQFFEVNFKEEHQNDGAEIIKNYLHEAAKDPSLGFYYVYEITSPNGYLREHLAEILLEQENALEGVNAREISWLNEFVTLPKKKLTDFAKIPEHIYEMAANYLEPRFRRLEPTLEMNKLRDALAFVVSFHEELNHTRVELMSFVESTTDHVMKDSSDLFLSNDNVNEYYTGMLHDFLADDERFDAIYQRLWRCTDKTEIKLYIAEIENFISQVVLNLNMFQKSVVSDLNEIFSLGQPSRTEKSVFDDIWDWIIKNQVFNVLLKSGGKNLHSEINVFLDVHNQMPVRTKKGPISRDKINLFYNENNESIEILYHLGAFAKEDLYYNAIYDAKR